MAVFRQPITAVVVIFWFFFWLLNGLDKFFARQDFLFWHWWGNHRVEKFTMYFEKLGLDPVFVPATLLFAGIVEIAAAGAFLFAAVRLVQGGPGVAYRADLAIAVSIAIFLAFTVFDVIVGDRAELLEHSTYIGVLLVSFLAVAAESFFNHLRDLDAKSTINRHYPPQTGRSQSQ